MIDLLDTNFLINFSIKNSHQNTLKNFFIHILNFLISTKKIFFGKFPFCQDTFYITNSTEGIKNLILKLIFLNFLIVRAAYSPQP